MNLIGTGVAGAVAGVMAAAIVFPLFVYALVFFEILIRPWAVFGHLRRLRPSYAMSLGTVFSFILVAGLGFIAWLDPPDDTVAGPDTMSPAEFRAFWIGLLIGVMSVVLVRRWLDQWVASLRAAAARVGSAAGPAPFAPPAPFTPPLRFNPPPGWPPAPPGWTPPPGWVPPPNFPPPPPGWPFWI